MPTAGLAEEKELTEKRVNRNGDDMRIKGETQIQRTEAFIRNTIAGKELLSEKPEVYVWEIQEFGVEEPNMSSGSAERHARTLRRQGVLEHPEGNKHAYITVRGV